MLHYLITLSIPILALGNKLNSNLTDLVPSVRTLPCGACIDAGFIYCRKGKNDDVFDWPFDSDFSNCCTDALMCPEINDP